LAISAGRRSSKAECFSNTFHKDFVTGQRQADHRSQHLSQKHRHCACPTNPEDPVLGLADDNVLAIRAALAARLADKAERLSEPRNGGNALWSAVREANWQLPPDWDVPSPVSVVGKARRRLSHAGADMPVGARPIWVGWVSCDPQLTVSVPVSGIVRCHPSAGRRSYNPPLRSGRAVQYYLGVH